MRILFLSAEMAPYVKVGGLGDVVGALPAALRQLGHDVRVVIPRYRQIDPARYQLTDALASFTFPAGWETITASLLQGESDGVPVYFVDIPWLFGDRGAVYGDGDDARRFILFTVAALRAIEILAWKPDVLHVHDWHTALGAVMLRSGHLGAFFRDTGSLLTIHNIAYQGQASRASLDGAATFIPGYVPDAWVNLLALGIQNAGVVTAVSPTFAAEMRTPLGGMGLDGVLRSRGDRVRGVLNGIDTREFDPAADPRLPAHYDVMHPEGKAACKRALQEEAGLAIDPSLPLLGMVSRLVDQKGFDLVADTLPRLIPDTPLQVVILGTGHPRYEALLRLLQERYPERVRAFFAFDAALAQRIYAGSDMFLMPSLFEPCGLGQLIAMRYGTVPVVRAVGGLLDTVHEGPAGDPGTGFVFWLYESGHLEDCLHRAIQAFQRPDEWSRIVRNDMLQDYSWERSARVYARLYESAHDPSIPLPVE